MQRGLDEIPKGALILVTGANGYIASHTCDILLGLGYCVRGTVRSEKPWLEAFFERKYGPGRFETVVVTSLAEMESWKWIVSGVQGISHVVRFGIFPMGPYVTKRGLMLKQYPGMGPIHEWESWRGNSPDDENSRQLSRGRQRRVLREKSCFHFLFCCRLHLRAKQRRCHDYQRWEFQGSGSEDIRIDL